jgi:hypothetical protein
MVELLLRYGFDTLKYSYMKATIDIYTLVNYSVAKEYQQLSRPSIKVAESGEAAVEHRI